MPWDNITWIGLVVTSYLMGGIPTAYVATRLATGGDIRQLGDRNSGAANVFRNVGPRAGMLVGAVDVVKGVIAVLLVRGLTDSTPLMMTAGVAVIAGHNWPLIMRFQGGRGAATAVGVLLAVLPFLAVPVAIVAFVILYATKKAVNALGLFLIAVPVLAWLAGYSYATAVYSLAIPLLVGCSHVLSVRNLAAAPGDGTTQGDELALPQR